MDICGATRPMTAPRSSARPVAAARAPAAVQTAWAVTMRASRHGLPPRAATTPYSRSLNRVRAYRPSTTTAGHALFERRVGGDASAWGGHDLLVVAQPAGGHERLRAVLGLPLRGGFEIGVRAVPGVDQGMSGVGAGVDGALVQHRGVGPCVGGAGGDVGRGDDLVGVIDDGLGV